MRDQPTGDQLLETARDLLRDELLPVLPGDKRHSALMIANAMAIALRQLKSGDEPERRELDSLKTILATRQSDLRQASASLMQALVDCNRSLCRMIRAGAADSGQFHDQVRAHLVETTRHRVSVSNPRYLG